MGAIEKIVDFLKEYPFVPFERREDAIRALPSSENGFEVALLVNAGNYTVCYAFWHTEFTDEQMSVNALINGLTDDVRLKVASRGKVDYRWNIQFQEPQGWVTGSAVFIFHYPFWKEKKIRYLQNDYFFVTEAQGETASTS